MSIKWQKKKKTCHKQFKILFISIYNLKFFVNYNIIEFNTEFIIYIYLKKIYDRLIKNGNVKK